ncbi:MAG: alpha/beta fold hydrolase [Thermoleophilia bacterium]|nr:alpha/beta fold hydrolase [Thermoleophilia bacterium]
MAASPVRFLSPREEGLVPSLELAGLLYLPDRPDGRPAPGLVVGHGAGSRAARHADFCLAARRQGFVVLGLDFRGHGDSQGRGDGPLELDLTAAARFLRDRPEVDPLRVCYRGSSMGGFYGLKAAPETGFAALALVCPAGEATMLTSIDRGDGRPGADASTRWDSRRLRAYFERQDSRAVATRVSCPVLLVHARGDEVVPFAHSLLLAKHLRTDTTLLALEGGSHTSAQHDPAIHAYTAAWLWGKVTGA